MTSFLSWLWAQADKAYAWLGDQFWALYAGAYNAWTWAVTQSAAALSAARTYAYNLYRGVLDDLSGLYDWAGYQIGLLWSAVQAGAGVTWSAIAGWMTDRLAEIRSAIETVRVYAAGLAAVLRSELIALIDSGLSLLRDWVNDEWGWILTLRQGLIDLLSMFTPANLAKLEQLLGEWWSTLTDLLDHPLVWLLDLLSHSLLDALSWLVAWSLGAVSDDLPSSPPWRR